MACDSTAKTARLTARTLARLDFTDDPNVRFVVAVLRHHGTMAERGLCSPSLARRMASAGIIARPVDRFGKSTGLRWLATGANLRRFEPEPCPCDACNVEAPSEPSLILLHTSPLGRPSTPTAWHAEGGSKSAPVGADRSTER